MKFDEIVEHLIISNGSTFIYEDRKYHVVTHIFDNGRIIYIVKFYGKHEQWWHYEAWDAQQIDFRLEFQMITNLKRI